LPYRSPEARDLPEAASYRDMAYATTVEPLLTLVNRAHFDKQLPAGSLAELTAALGSAPQRLHGRIASYDIERNGLIARDRHIDQDFGDLLDQQRRRALLRRWQAAVAGLVTAG
jgi:iron(III) transport system substrate-binding protein